MHARLASRGIAFLALLGALSTALTGCGSGETSDRSTPTLNVILIVIDTLRADRTSLHGNTRRTTPHIDRLAAKSRTFTRALSQAPWTTPSIGSLLSSQYPSRLGIQQIRSVLPGEFVLLPEVLRDAGYTTGAVVSHSYCSRRWGFGRGFASFDESNIGLEADTPSAPGVTDRAIEFIDATGDQPFFLLAHYFDPHSPYVEHPSHRFDGAVEPGGRIRSPAWYLQLKRIQPRLQRDDFAELLRIYDSEVALTDAHVGRLIDHLRSVGIHERTLIVLTADHGEEFGDHGDLGHAHSLYQELLHVPLVFFVPGGRPEVIDVPVPLLDVYPTLLAELGIAAPSDLAGIPLMERREQHPTPIFSETSRPAKIQSIVRGRFKLIRYEGKELLYDLETDPAERHDVSDLHRPLAEGLRSELSAWSRSQRPRKRGSPLVELSEAERERLRALGYTE